MRCRVSSRFLLAPVVHVGKSNLSAGDVESVQVWYGSQGLAASSGRLQSDGHLMVRFDRSRVAAWFTDNQEFSSFEELIITGNISGTPFEGADTIRVINPYNL